MFYIHFKKRFYEDGNHQGLLLSKGSVNGRETIDLRLEEHSSGDISVAG